MSMSNAANFRGQRVSDDFATPTDHETGPPSSGTYTYRYREVVEPDWRRLPGWRDVSEEQWESARAT